MSDKLQFVVVLTLGDQIDNELPNGPTQDLSS